jgi:hypothetical protein
VAWEIHVTRPAEKELSEIPPPSDCAYHHQLPIGIEVEEDAPVADASPPRGGLGLEPCHVATERVSTHRGEPPEDTLTIARTSTTY